MSQSRRRTIRFAVAGVCVAALLILIGRLALREPPVSPNERPPAVVVTRPPVSHIASLPAQGSDAVRETISNRVIGTTSANAAAIYRQAFALFEALSNEEKEVISNWRTNIDPSVEAELCEKIQPICELMHQAATLTNCDWGIEEPITFTTALPHLNRCRSIARAAVWSAVHCRTGDQTGAVDDLVATSRLGQNTSPAIIGYLVDLAIQNLVIGTVTEHASILAGAGDARLSQFFGDAHYENGLYRAIEQEADILSGEADKLAAMPPEEAVRETKGLGGDDSGSQSIDPVQAIAAMRQVVDLERECAQVLGSSDAEYREWLARLEAIVKTNSFAGTLLTAVETMVDRTQATTIRSAMVVAGLAVIQDGPNALLSHPDPVTGQQFTYRQTANGFELQSSYQVNGQPLKLSFK